jgi:predicted nucleotidyltransferase
MLNDINQNRINQFCQKWNVTEFALFGSAVRQDFGLSSDVDVLVTLAPDAHTTLFDLVGMENELEEIFGRKVDLVSRRGLEASRNYIRRKAILSSAQVLYAA